MANQALEQTRGSVLWHGEPVGRELLNLIVRRLTRDLARFYAVASAGVLAVAPRQQGSAGIYALQEINRTLALAGKEDIVVNALRGEMHDNQRLVIIKGVMKGLLERGRVRSTPAGGEPRLNI